MTPIAVRFPTFTALAALVRRDLAGNRRGATLLTARTLAALGASALVLFVYTESNADGRSIVGPGMVGTTIFGALGLVTLLLAPALSVTTLRRERDAGTLDLLLMAGLDPVRLAVGRALSTFLLLGSLVTCVLPALALLWFFRRMALPELLACTAVYLAWCLALAGAVVAISAWARSGGVAVMLTIVVAILWFFQQSLAGTGTHPTAATWLLGEAAERSYTPWIYRNDYDLLLGLLLHALAGFGLALVAARGLARRTTERTSDAFARRVLGAPRAGTRWPLTWLLQREHAATRPKAQFLALILMCGLMVTTALAFYWATGRLRILARSPAPLLGTLGAVLLGAAWLLLLLTSAWPAAGMRERATWDSLLSTRVSARRLLLDLAHGALVAGAVPLAAGAALLVSAALLAGAPPATALALAASFASASALALALGLAASLAGGSSAIALTLALAGPLVLAVPAALTPWLCGPVLDVDLPLADGWGVAVPVALLLVLLAGAALAFLRRGAASATLGVLLGAGAGLPLALASLPPHALDVASGGGAAALQRAIVLAFGEHGQDAVALLAGAAWQALTALALFAVLFSRAERMIGRPQ